MKKNFTGGLNSLLGEPQPSKPESNQPDLIPQPDSFTPMPELEATPAPAVKSTQLGTRSGEARATFIVNEATHEKIKAIAYWDRIQIKEVIDEALSQYINQYEQQHGMVKPIPTRKG